MKNASPFDRLLKAPLRYSFEAGPDRVRNLADARTHGVNCGALAHLVLQEIFQVELPMHLMPYEMLYDREYFVRVGSQDCLKMGDVIFFGYDVVLDPDNPPAMQNGTLIDWQSHPHLHLAVCIQDAPNLESAPYIHATNWDRRRVHAVRIWQLEQFQRTIRYRRIHGIRRLQNQLIKGS